MARKTKTQSKKIELTPTQVEFLTELLNDIDTYKEEDEDLSLYWYCPIYVQKKHIKSLRSILKKLEKH